MSAHEFNLNSSTDDEEIVKWCVKLKVRGPESGGAPGPCEAEVPPGRYKAEVSPGPCEAEGSPIPLTFQKTNVELPFRGYWLYYVLFSFGYLHFLPAPKLCRFTPTPEFRCINFNVNLHLNSITSRNVRCRLYTPIPPFLVGVGVNVRYCRNDCYRVYINNILK
jgi:hypothetical protein